VVAFEEILRTELFAPYLRSLGGCGLGRWQEIVGWVAA